ncbi:MAG TPA: hypothetical protein VJQ57_14075 [Acidimicrobiia bacterium]|nr:hypothetical protein [Acidimicrobiia bacterium]
MSKLLIAFVSLVAGALGLARVLLVDRINEESDEIDLAVVAARRRYRIRARPFIGATILVTVGDAELDLRRAVPSPTGIEVNALVICGRLSVIANADWNVDNPLGEGTLIVNPDAFTVRIRGRRILGRVQVEHRSALTVLAS